MASATVIVLATTFGSSCRRVEPPKHYGMLGIEQVLANPRAYSHKMVTVHGCFIAGFERTTLQPCRSAKLDEVVWLTDAAMIHSLEELQPPGVQIPEPTELKTQAKSALVFAFDGAKNRAAWAKLIPDSAPQNYRAEVTVVGQFETIAPQKPDAMRSGFGHLGVFANELILVDVLDSRELRNANQ